jgi:hypothetical protein
MRKLLAIVTVAVFAVGVYALIRDRESLRVKKAMLELVDELDLTKLQRGRVRLLVEAFHADAFRASSEQGRLTGDALDWGRYQNEIFSRLIEQTRKDEPALAERLSEQQKAVQLLRPDT